MGREEPLISEFLTTALENLLPTVGGKTQFSNTHTPKPGNFPIADVYRVSRN